MIKIHTMASFHYQYQPPHPVAAPKKEEATDKPLTFQEILNQKMKEKNVKLT
ncbi:hypothetical protein SAMN04488688_111160 [Paenibacillus sp. cl141a]|uniref:hypothetical protein n=1 Tax=Paenibacillus sp. cl141a TaxID=1761877 RepID=UPI0008CFA3F2|nr:hypothetical protein [Paenibacillus sp. cl141a]SEM32509.1 hypothetical protein SAMN04488688_111160 [Paenibacillus sp. cl141a]